MELEWYQQLWSLFKELINPESIIKYGGLPLLIAVVFAETGLLVGFFLPGDSLLFIAGLLCGTNSFGNHNVLEVLLYVTIAAVVGDQVGYVIGKKAGPKVFRRQESFFFKPNYVTMTKHFYDRHGGKALILGRFLPIIRTFAPVFAGVVQLEYKRFVFYNIAGGVLWVFSMILMGYYLQPLFYHLFNINIKEYLHYITVGIIILSTYPVIKMVIDERKLHQLRKQNPAQQNKELNQILDDIEKHNTEIK